MINTYEKELIEVRKEKTQLKQIWSNPFLNELNLILEKCFLKPKSKKEHFITQEKLEVEIIKLLQSQKRFISKENFRTSLNTQAAFDKIENNVGKILNINLVERTVDIFTIHKKTLTRSFDNVNFFDIYSLEFLVAFEKQKIIHNFTYKDTFRFLTHSEKLAPIVHAERFCFENQNKLLIPINYNK